MLEFFLNKVAGLQYSNFIKERLQHRYFPVNIVKLLKIPFLKNICERLLLLIVIFSQESDHLQPCLDLREPKLYKKRTCVMLVHIPQTTFHRKIIYNFVWIYLGRSSCSEVFCKIGILRIIAKLTKKHLCKGLFLINLQPQACNLIKKETLVLVFSVDSVKFRVTPFVTEHLRWLLLSRPTLHKEITCGMLAYG